MASLLYHETTSWYSGIYSDHSCNARSGCSGTNPQSECVRYKRGLLLDRIAEKEGSQVFLRASQQLSDDRKANAARIGAAIPRTYQRI